jgi:hypothetical protein
MALARRLFLPPAALAMVLGLGILTGGRPSESQPPAPSTPSPAEAGAPRLIGVVIAQDGRGRAYLQDPQTGGVRAYEVGEAVGDARVVAIEPDRVVLDRSGSRIDIRFGGPSGGAAPPGSTAPPKAEPAAPPQAETGPPPVPATGASPPTCPPDCPAASAPGSATCPPFCAPGQPGAAPVPSSGCPPACPTPPAADPQACPANCPVPAVPFGPATRPSP